MKKSQSFIKCTILVVWLASINHSFIIAQSSPPLFSGKQLEIEQLLISNDWNGVWATLNSQKGTIHDSLLCKKLAPEFRLLLGHSALATNHSNTASWSFYCDCDSTSSQSLINWQSFTERLAMKYPNNPNVLYLYADALARNDKLEEAKQRLDSVLFISNSHVLARNARGIIQWILFEKTNNENFQEGCLIDLEWCKTTHPTFVDCWINLGVQNFRNNSFELSQSNFKAVLAKDSESILGKIGIAVIYATQKDNRRFFSAVDDLYKKIPNFPLVVFNSGNSKVFPKSIRGMNFGVSGSISPFGVLGPTYSGAVNISKTISSDGSRGGVFLCVDENNSPIIKDGSARVAGVTFALNYPFPKINIEPIKK